ncbi:MAG: ABC transporter ATP-binding protein [Geobacteraceae bacterium]|nr:ABC transporter ATP-binding protein [Geobacteraceae bacterium]
MNDTLLDVSSLYKSYGSGDQKVEVLKGVSLSLRQGETVALLGASGAGKSTLMHILGALDRPTSGSVSYFSENIFGKSESQLAGFRNSTIGFVFQFHHLLPEFTATENVMMPLLINGTSRQKAAESARAILSEVGLGHRVTHKPGELSGGEQQRVAVARALVMEPKLLLADEPTGNLDMKTSESIHDLFEDLHSKRGLSIMVVTHNERLASRTMRQIRLEDGKVQG